jgi:hypothetical protein
MTNLPKLAELEFFGLSLFKKQVNNTLNSVIRNITMHFIYCLKGFQLNFDQKEFREKESKRFRYDAE